MGLFGGVQSSSTTLFRYPTLKFLLKSIAKRRFSAGGASPQWRNETPPGGLTELYVYRPETARIWPDPVLGVLSPQDPALLLPGNVGILERVKEHKQDLEERPPIYSSDLLASDLPRERQVSILHTASDYIHHNSAGQTTGLCSDILETFPEMDGMRNLHCQLQEAPLLLKRELQLLFPGMDLGSFGRHGGHVSVLTMARRTINDMTGWSTDVEEERENLVLQFVTAAKEICARLKNEGYWADFIDPGSGTPYYHRHTNVTMFETDEKYRLLGFRIEDLGCCKVITHRDFGRHVFVGTIFTNASTATGVVQDIFSEMEVILDGLKSNSTKFDQLMDNLFQQQSPLKTS